MEEKYSDVQLLVELIKNAKGSIVIFTGAGVSTSAAIPDYRGRYGLWRRLAEDSRSPDKIVTDSVMNQRAASAKLRLPEASLAKPTFTHMAIKRLVDLGYVRHVVSQNVDGLHLRSGLCRAKLSEFHGNLFLEQCQSCMSNVFRLFDVAETTGRSQHLTGRICPGCRADKPDDARRAKFALEAAKEMLLAKGKYSSCTTEAKMQLCRKAAEVASRQYDLSRDQIKTITKVENVVVCTKSFGPNVSSKLTIVKTKNVPIQNAQQKPLKLPFLRDTIVNYYEKQNVMGLKEIYRVQEALAAIHGTRCMHLIHSMSTGKVHEVAKVRLGGKRKQPWLKVTAWDMYWPEKIRYAHDLIGRENRLRPTEVDDSTGSTSTVSEEAAVESDEEDEDDCTKKPILEPAKLIITIGTSLSVLRHYKFLWPIGLGKCQQKETPPPKMVKVELIERAQVVPKEEDSTRMQVEVKVSENEKKIEPIEIKPEIFLEEEEVKRDQDSTRMQVEVKVSEDEKKIEPIEFKPEIFLEEDKKPSSSVLIKTQSVGSESPPTRSIQSMGKNGCALVVNSIQPTCKDGVADLVLRMKCDDLLKTIMEKLEIPVPDYCPTEHDQILQWAVPIPQEEECTKTRLNFLS